MNETEPTEPVRWGFIGASTVAHEHMVSAVRLAGHEVIAIASGSLERATHFAAEHGIAFATDSAAQENVYATFLVLFGAALRGEGAPAASGERRGRRALVGSGAGGGGGGICADWTAGANSSLGRRRPRRTRLKANVWRAAAAMGRKQRPLCFDAPGLWPTLDAEGWTSLGTPCEELGAAT